MGLNFFGKDGDEEDEYSYGEPDEELMGLDLDLGGLNQGMGDIDCGLGPGLGGENVGPKEFMALYHRRSGEVDEERIKASSFRDAVQEVERRVKRNFEEELGTSIKRINVTDGKGEVTVYEAT